jgi:hypothetical protein
MTDLPAKRIAMWSGPRNISTAMMRAFENRPDCAVIDEPFYAAYLARTGIIHPMRAQVMASQPQDPAEVIASLLGPVPDNAAIFYQKHMTHHMIESIDLGWMAGCDNVFLIRAPQRVVASYARKRSEANFADLGFARQAELFDREADRLGKAPLVIDADDVLADPQGMLQSLCAALGIPFSAHMLRWPAGRRATDGVWAAHWYQAVEASTGFAAPAALADADLPEELKPAEEIYDRLHAFRLTP